MRSLKAAFETPELNASPQAHTYKARPRRWLGGRQRFMALLLCFGLLSTLFVAHWANRTGRLDLWQIRTQLWFANLLASRGLTAVDIDVVGLDFTTQDQIRHAIQAYNSTPLSLISPHDIRTRIETLPWVETAMVQRIWPNTLKIWLSEKQPMAILHSENQAHVLGTGGDKIIVATENISQSLPHISGPGAAEQAQTLFYALRTYPQIYDGFVGANRISDRRWDIYLSPGLVVKLPAGDSMVGLARLQSLIDSDNILNKDIRSLDLRGRRAVISK